MRRLTLCVALCAAMAMGACVQSGDILLDDNYTIINVGLDNPTKTSLGEKGDDGFYPIHWVESDRLVVNGVASSGVTLNKDNPTRAGFKFSGILEHPYYITFPYTEGSSCSATKPTIVFPAEQSYVAGTFDVNAAPMYGYTNETEDSTPLTHLAGVLRLPFKATAGAPVIKQISITPTSEESILAGEYAIDCQTGELTVVEGTTSKAIIYSLGDGVTLSTSEAIPFHITLPAGSFGKCIIAVTDTEGNSMLLGWTANNVKAGVVREFKNIPYTANGELVIDSLDSEMDDLYVDSSNGMEDMDSYTDGTFVDYIPGVVFGYVKDSAGNPLSGIQVSDGFKIVTTNENGYYSMEMNMDTGTIFYISPAEYAIPINQSGQPCFFELFSPFRSLYNFTLTPLPGGAEEKFMIFGLADPQVSSDAGFARFVNEAVPKIKAHADSYTSQGIPCYGIVLGDIISMSRTKDLEPFMKKMHTQFAKDNCGLDIFYVMGNHDHTFFNGSYPLTSDWRNSTFNIQAQRYFERNFGPVDFSFNRGNAHIISMRNMIFNSETDLADYDRGFTDEQFAWLQADLASVPKDKLIIFCVHIPLYNTANTNVRNVLALLNEYSNVHILSGHKHYNRNFEHSVYGTSYTNIYEHNLGAVCGNWWCANICADGAPSGYKVFEVTNNKMTNWYYMGYPDGMDDPNYQIRLYRGNAVTGAERPEDAAEDSEAGYFQFGFEDNVLLANIFSSDSQWTVEIYEDGSKTGEMEWMYQQSVVENITYSDLVGGYTLEDPRRVADGVITSHDFWAHGLLLGLLGRALTSNGSFFPCWTMWRGTLQNPNATKIEVLARDRFNNTYTCDVITEGTDYTNATKPE